MVVEIQFKQAIKGQTFALFYDLISQSSSLFGCKLVRWKAVAIGVLTLNTDGFSKGNRGVCGGGGVLHDSNAHPLVAFSSFLGNTSSL